MNRRMERAEARTAIHQAMPMPMPERRESGHVWGAVGELGMATPPDVVTQVQPILRPMDRTLASRARP